MTAFPRCVRCGLIFLRTDDYLGHRTCRPADIPPTPVPAPVAGRFARGLFRAIANSHPSVAPGPSRVPVERRAVGPVRRWPDGSFDPGGNPA